MPYKDTNIIVSIVDLIVAYRKDIIEQYRVYSNIIQNLSNKSIQIFRAISSQWYQLLELDSRKLYLSAKYQQGLLYSTPLASLTLKRSQSLSGILQYSGEISRASTDKSVDPLSSRDQNLGQKPYKNPFLDRFQIRIYRESLLVLNIVLLYIDYYLLFCFRSYLSIYPLLRLYIIYSIIRKYYTYLLFSLYQ